MERAELVQGAVLPATAGLGQELECSTASIAFRINVAATERRAVEIAGSIPNQIAGEFAVRATPVAAETVKDLVGPTVRAGAQFGNCPSPICSCANRPIEIAGPVEYDAAVF